MQRRSSVRYSRGIWRETMNAKKKSILYLAHRIPYPPNKGDKIRSFNEIKYLSQEHDLNLAFLVDDPQDLRHVSELERYTRTIDYAVINPRWQKVKSIPYLLTDKPLSIPYFYSPVLQESIDKRLDVTEVDVVFCFSSPMAEYVFNSRHFKMGKLKNAQLIMDFVDVDSDKWRMYAGFSNFPLSAVYRREWRRLQAYDARVGQAFDRSIFVSDKEVDLFRSFCPRASTAAIANGVDIEYFAAAETLRQRANGSCKEPTVLFMGAMDYYPNQDAVVYFADEIWPLVKEVFSNARFVIAGSNPTGKVKALAQADQSITVTGFVTDIRPYLAQAEVFVAPFRIARGIQNKVLEAMAAGVPVVTSSEAVQGFGIQDLPLRIESSPGSFAASIVELLQDEGKRAAMAMNAQHFVRTCYCWDTSMAALQSLF